MNPVEKLPESVTCPNCSIELELNEYERKERKFICPLCEKPIDMTDDNFKNIKGAEEYSTQIKSMESDIDFIPEEYLFTTKFNPNLETITLSCHKCENKHEISNPAKGNIDDKLNLIDISIFRKAGIGYSIAFIIASIPGLFILGNIDNLFLAIILWMIIGLPIYYVLREFIVKALGITYKVGFINCDSCKENIFIAFDNNNTYLLKSKKLVYK